MSPPNYKFLYFGTFFLSASTLVLEVLLTRIFSVTTYYHFSFLILSLVMFGLSFGGALLFVLKRKLNSDGAILKYLNIFSILYSVASLIAPFIILSLKFSSATAYLNGSFLMIDVFVLLITFTLSGVAMAISITNFGDKTPVIYAFDFFGGSLGCLLAVFVLNNFGIVASLSVVPFLGLCSTILFNLFYKMSDYTSRRYQLLLVFIFILFFALYRFGGLNKYMYITSLKQFENHENVTYEKWNVYSKVTLSVFPNNNTLVGISAKNQPRNLDFQMLRIDADAATPILHINSDVSNYSFLKNDISVLAYNLRNNADIAVVGSGGQKDVLTALLFNAKSVTSIEINSTITDLIKGKLKTYTGNIVDNPAVTLVNAEARAFLTETPKKFDIISISLIDTWAASSAGAYGLTENNLYTIEAICTFLNSTTSNGIVSYSRWYDTKNPAEIYRLLALVGEGVRKCTHKNDVSRQVLVANNKIPNANTLGLTTVLFSKSNFDTTDMHNFDAASKNNDFEILYPSISGEPHIFSDLINGDLKEVQKTISTRVTPPTDDSPFFFNFSSPVNTLLSGIGLRESPQKVEESTSFLVTTLLIDVALSFILLLFPIFFGRFSGELKLQYGNALYFGALGLGFMLVEVALLQSFSVYLGHPATGLVVVLFSLLLSAGFGSQLVHTVLKRHNNPWYLLLLAVLVLFVFSRVTPLLFVNTKGYTLLLRSCLAIILILPIGLVLGFGVPLGMSLLVPGDSQYRSWLWTVNSAFSVLGSGLALFLAVSYSISTSYLCGVILYLCCALYLYTKSYNRQK